MDMYRVTFSKTDQDISVTKNLRLSSLINLLTEKINYEGFNLDVVLTQIKEEGQYKGIHRNNIVTIEEFKHEI